MGQLGRGEGDYGIGAVGFGGVELARVRIPARGEIDRDHWSSGITLEQLAADDRQVAHRGTKAGAENRVHKELRALKKGLAVGGRQVGFLLMRSASRGAASTWPRVALHLRRVTQHQDGDGTAGFHQMTAATRPSPPLLPLPHSTTMRRHWGNSRKMKRLTACPACSISSREEMPKRSVVTRSAFRISAAVSIFIS